MTDTIQSVIDEMRESLAYAGFDIGNTERSELEEYISRLQALAASEREAVGMVCHDNSMAVIFAGNDLAAGTKLFAHPPAADVVAYASVSNVLAVEKLHYCKPRDVEYECEYWDDQWPKDSPHRVVALIVHPDDIRTVTQEGLM